MHSISYKKSAQAAIRHWLDKREWINPFAVTLNLKQVMQCKNKDGQSLIRLDEHRASQNLKHFINKVTKHYHGHAGQRYGKKLPIIPVLEGGNGNRLHYHLMIDLPEAAQIEDVHPFFADTWMRTDWGYGRVDIQQNPDGGWLNYITKLRSKVDVGEAIDWMNLYHPSLTAR